MLDIGCGTGISSRVFANEFGAVVSSVDLVDVNEFSETILCPIWELPKRLKFDLVFCAGTIEQIHKERLPAAIDRLGAVCGKWAYIDVRGAEPRHFCGIKADHSVHSHKNWLSWVMLRFGRDIYSELPDDPITGRRMFIWMPQ